MPRTLTARGTMADRFVPNSARQPWGPLCRRKPTLMDGREPIETRRRCCTSLLYRPFRSPRPAIRVHAHSPRRDPPAVGCGAVSGTPLTLLSAAW
jgi:hypothetical protein